MVDDDNTADHKPAATAARRQQITNYIKKHARILSLLIIVVILLVWGPTVYVNLKTRHDRYSLGTTSIGQIPKNSVALVFGAGVTAAGQPTPYLRWRVQTAVQLYKAGRVQKLLMSGDNSTQHYNEPAAMRKLAEQLGVKPADIVLDYAGYSTYDSCYRAHHIFGLSQATLVSQGYHLPRAIFSCDGLGIRSIGIDAEGQGRDWTVAYIIREWFSTDKAVVQNIFKPGPTVLGPKMPIT